MEKITKSDGSNWIDIKWLNSHMSMIRQQKFIQQFMIKYKGKKFLFEDVEEQYAEMIFSIFQGTIPLQLAPGDKTLGLILSRRLRNLQKKQPKEEPYNDEQNYDSR